MPWGSYFNYLSEWNKYAADENVMTITYEELKEVRLPLEVTSILYFKEQLFLTNKPLYSYSVYKLHDTYSMRKIIVSGEGKMKFQIKNCFIYICVRANMILVFSLAAASAQIIVNQNPQ